MDSVLTLPSDVRLDHNLQENIKDEINIYQLKSSPLPDDNIEHPLLIVLDEDDLNCDDETEQCNSLINEITLTSDLPNEQESKIDNSNDEQNYNTPSVLAKSLINKKKVSSANLFQSSKLLRKLRKHRLSSTLNVPTDQNSNQVIGAVVIDTACMRQSRHQQSNRTKLIARRKIPNKASLPSSTKMSNNSNTKNLSNEDDSHLSSPSKSSILSKISFDHVSDIVTVSRMGSVYYCLEDLYSKIFSRLCTLDEFTSLLKQPEIISLKPVNLSEKMALEQHSTLLKKFNDNRFRLISINSSDYLLKAKQLLLASEDQNPNDKQQREKLIERIIDDLRNYKRTSTPILSKDKGSRSLMTTKRLLSDDEDDEDEDIDDEETKNYAKNFKKKSKSNEISSLPPTQFGIFIQCNGPVSCNIFSTNETVSSSSTTTNADTTTTTTTTTVTKTESEIISKSTTIKKGNDNEPPQAYFDKLQHKHQHVSKYNGNNEQLTRSVSNLNPIDPESPSADCTQINKVCSSTTVMNMPIKRRILSSYTNEKVDCLFAASTITPISLAISSRSLHRSKSLTLNHQYDRTIKHRSLSLPSISYNFDSDCFDTKICSTEKHTVLLHKSKAESIDLTDEASSMPMIINVEENVKLAHERNKTITKTAMVTKKPIRSPTALNKDSKPQPSVTSNTHSISNETSMSVASATNIKYSPTQFPYNGTSSHLYYSRDTYASRIPNTSYNIPIKSNLNFGSYYSYPFSPSSTQYPSMKTYSDMPMNNCHDVRSHSVAPTHHSGLMSNRCSPNLPVPMVAPIIRKPNYCHQFTPEELASIKMPLSSPTSAPCRLSCCYPSPNTSQHQMDKSAQNERAIYRSYNPSTPLPQTIKRDPSQTPDFHNSLQANNRKQRRMDVEMRPTPTSTPSYPGYPSTKPYFAPPATPTYSSSYSIPSSPWSSQPTAPNSKYYGPYPYTPPRTAPNNNMVRKYEQYATPHRPIPVPSRSAPTPATTTATAHQNSSTLISPPNTPHEASIPNARIRSIDIQRAIAEHGFCDMDKIPKLVVRHVKTYPNRTIESMGQLFPTWFNEPDYRCIHCFRCDQVFTPQQFMTHVDDEHLTNEQPSNMTSIQLLTSEKMSEYKVGLWNQFCTNLTIFARDGRIGGFSANKNA